MTLSISDILRIADDFRDQWVSPEEPGIEQVLAQHDADLRDDAAQRHELLACLLEVELKKRHADDTTWDRAEYAARFPDDTEVIREVFRPQLPEPKQPLGGLIESLPAIDEVIGDYLRIRRLGQGGVGEVWLAEHRRKRYPVALKVPFATKFDVVQGYELIRREVEAVQRKRLRHPNIVGILDVSLPLLHQSMSEDQMLHELHETPMYIAFEYIDSAETFDSALAGGLPRNRALKVLSEVAAALAHAHSKGVYHLDVKPSNVLMDGDKPMLTDFGMGKLAGDGQNAMGGTPRFMSPERALRAHDVTGAADVWSLGVMLFEMLVGRRFDPGKIPVGGRLQPVRELVPQIPEPLARLCDHCLECDPASRPPAEEVQVRLLQYLNRAPGADVFDDASENVLPEYVRWLADTHSHIIGSVSFGGRLPRIPLDHVYIALKVQTSARLELVADRDLLDNTMKELSSALETGDVPRMEQQNLKLVALARDPIPAAMLDEQVGRNFGRHSNEVLTLVAMLRRSNRIVILGDPGSGKTTAARWLAMSFAKAYADPAATEVTVRRDHVDPDVNRSQQDESLGPIKLPVLIRVAEYARARRQLVVQRSRDRAMKETDAEDQLERDNELRLEQFLATLPWHGERPNVDLQRLQQQILTALQQGEAFVILDGLDEITDVDDRRRISAAVDAFIQRNTSAGNTILVTSRITGYRDAPLEQSSLMLRVEQLGDNAVKRFCESCMTAYRLTELPDTASHDDRQAKREQALAEAESLIRQVFDLDNPRLRELAANPLLITILVSAFYINQGKLPSHRSELYRVTIVDNLTEVWKQRDRSFSAEQALAALSEVAHIMQGTCPTGLMPRPQIVAALDRHLRDESHRNSKADAEDFLNDLREVSGLLIERGQYLHGFLHLTFQEYLAGLKLVGEWEQAPDAREVAKRMLRRADDARWREPLLLALGHANLKLGSERDFENLLAHLVEEGATDAGHLPWGAMLAVDALAESRPPSLQLARQLAQVLFAAYRRPDVFRVRPLRRRVEDSLSVLRAMPGESVDETLAAALTGGDVEATLSAAELIAARQWNSTLLAGALAGALHKDQADKGWIIHTALSRAVSSNERNLRMKPRGSKEQIPEDALSLSSSEAGLLQQTTIVSSGSTMNGEQIDTDGVDAQLPIRRLLLNRADLVKKVHASPDWTALMVTLYGGLGDFQIARLREEKNRAQQQIARRGAAEAAQLIDTQLAPQIDAFGKEAPSFDPQFICRDSHLTPLVESALENDESPDRLQARLRRLAGVGDSPARWWRYPLNLFHFAALVAMLMMAFWLVAWPIKSWWNGAGILAYLVWPVLVLGGLLAACGLAAITLRLRQWQHSDEIIVPRSLKPPRLWEAEDPHAFRECLATNHDELIGDAIVALIVLGDDLVPSLARMSDRLVARVSSRLDLAWSSLRDPILRSAAPVVDWLNRCTQQDADKQGLSDHQVKESLQAFVELFCRAGQSGLSLVDVNHWGAATDYVLAESWARYLDPHSDNSFYNACVALDTIGQTMGGSVDRLVAGFAEAASARNRRVDTLHPWHRLRPFPRRHHWVERLDAALEAGAEIPPDREVILAWLLLSLRKYVLDECPYLACEFVLLASILRHQELQAEVLQAYGADDWLVVEGLEGLLPRILGIPDPHIRLRALQRMYYLMPHLEDVDRQMRRSLEEIDNEVHVVLSIDRLLRHPIPGWERDELLTRGRQAAEKIADPQAKTYCCARMAFYLPMKDRRHLLRKAILAARSIRDDAERRTAFSELRAEIANDWVLNGYWRRGITNRPGDWNWSLDAETWNVMRDRLACRIERWRPWVGQESAADVAVWGTIRSAARITDALAELRERIGDRSFDEMDTEDPPATTGDLDEWELDEAMAARVEALQDPERIAEVLVRFSTATTGTRSALLKWSEGRHEGVRGQAAVLLLRSNFITPNIVDILVRMLRADDDLSRLRATLALHGRESGGGDTVLASQWGLDSLMTIARHVVAISNPGQRLVLLWTLERVVWDDPNLLRSVLERVQADANSRDAPAALQLVRSLERITPNAFLVLLEELQKEDGPSREAATEAVVRLADKPWKKDSQHVGQAHFLELKGWLRESCLTLTSRTAALAATALGKLGSTSEDADALLFATNGPSPLREPALAAVGEFIARSVSKATRRLAGIRTKLSSLQDIGSSPQEDRAVLAELAATAQSSLRIADRLILALKSKLASDAPASKRYTAEALLTAGFPPSSLTQHEIDTWTIVEALVSACDTIYVSSDYEARVSRAGRFIESRVSAGEEDVLHRLVKTTYSAIEQDLTGPPAGHDTCDRRTNKASNLLPVLACVGELLPSAFTRLVVDLPDLPKFLAWAAERHITYPGRVAAITLMSLTRRLNERTCKAILCGLKDTEPVQKGTLLALQRFRSLDETNLPQLLRTLSSPSTVSIYSACQMLSSVGTSLSVSTEHRLQIRDALYSVAQRFRQSDEPVYHMRRNRGHFRIDSQGWLSECVYDCLSRFFATEADSETGRADGPLGAPLVVSVPLDNNEGSQSRIHISQVALGDSTPLNAQGSLYSDRGQAVPSDLTAVIDRCNELARQSRFSLADTVVMAYEKSRLSADSE